MKGRCNFKKTFVPVNAEGQTLQVRKLLLFPSWKQRESWSSFPGLGNIAPLERAFVVGWCTESSPSCFILLLRACRTHTSKSQISDVFHFFCSIICQHREHFSVPVKYIATSSSCKPNLRGWGGGDAAQDFQVWFHTQPQFSHVWLWAYGINLPFYVFLTVRWGPQNFAP